MGWRTVGLAGVMAAVLVVAAGAAAQDDGIPARGDWGSPLPAPPAGESEAEALPPPPPEIAPGMDAHAHAPGSPLDEVDDDGDAGAELLLGVVGYALGATAGIGLMLASVESSDGSGLLLTIPLGVLIAGAGLAGGITLGGEMTGGNGSFWSAFGGQALGGLASLAVLLATSEEDVTVGLASMVVLPIAGGMIGYELSDDSRDRRADVHWRAAAAPSADGRGALASLSATF